MLPTPAEYKLAFELAEDNFESRQIAPLRENGRIWMSNHGFACVFKGVENGQPVAVKCFTKPVAERQERYQRVADFVAHRREPHWTRFEYLPEEFFVDSSAGSQLYDVVLMPWVEGQTLGDCVARACERGDRPALQQLADRFDRLAAWLLAQDFAHGDLKHDNLMVRPNGDLVLIDYDGMYVPALRGRPALEAGGRGYQHPARTTQFDRHLDDFSILIIRLSLHALAAEPGLHGAKTTDNLLLAPTDLAELAGSAMLAQLFGLDRPEINRSLVLLYQSLAAQRLEQPHLPALLATGASSPDLPRTYPETVGGVSFTMVYVAGGSFPMGDTFGDDGYEDELPVHEVTLDGYYLAETEVTQALWRAVMGSNPSNFENGQCPVEMVSWDDAQAFITKLNQLTGKKYGLPTEAQWEYAARERGKNIRFGNGQDTLRPTQANFDAEYVEPYSEVGEYRAKTTPVKTFAPNALGLYDLTGNVWECCQDWYGEDYYQHSPSRNPTGPSTGPNRAARGGSWGNSPQGARVAFRYSYTPEFRYADLGFRLARMD